MTTPLLLTAALSCTQPDTSAGHTNSTALPLAIEAIPSTATYKISVDGLVDNISYLELSDSILAWGINHQNQYTLWNINPSDQSVVELLDGLPDASERSYNKTLELSNGHLAISYQSDAQFGQSGTHHGVLILNPATGSVVQDLIFQNASNPEGLVEYAGQLYVLAANRQANAIPSLLKYVVNENYALIHDKTLNTTAKNASDMSFYITNNNHEPRFVISTTGTEASNYSPDGSGGVLTNTTPGQILEVNPATLTVVKETSTAPSLGMSLSVNDELDSAFVSGVATESSEDFLGEIDLAANNAAFSAYGVSDFVEETIPVSSLGLFIFGVQTKGFLGGDLLSLNFMTPGSNNTVSPTPIVFDLANEVYTQLESDPALFASPVLIEDNFTAYSAGGTSVAANGLLSSTIYIFGQP